MDESILEGRKFWVWILRYLKYFHPTNNLNHICYYIFNIVNEYEVGKRK